MSQQITFMVQGEPVAKARARVFRTASGVRAVTPEKTVRFEARVREAAQAALSGCAPLAGRCELEVKSAFTLARSNWKKREPLVEQLRDGKPDVDNLLKAVADALNGIAWLDDRQVARATVSKWNTAQGEAGYTLVTIRPLDEVFAPSRAVVTP